MLPFDCSDPYLSEYHNYSNARGGVKECKRRIVIILLILLCVGLVVFHVTLECCNITLFFFHQSYCEIQRE